MLAEVKKWAAPDLCRGDKSDDNAGKTALQSYLRNIEPKTRNYTLNAGRRRPEYFDDAHMTFQMTEAAVSRQTFAEILARIDRLRCCAA